MKNFLEYFNESALILDDMEQLNEVAVMPTQSKNDNVLVLVGGPGSGKSWIYDNLVEFPRTGYLNPDTLKEQIDSLLKVIKKKMGGTPIYDKKGEKVIDYEVPEIDIDTNLAKQHEQANEVFKSYLNKYPLFKDFVIRFQRLRFVRDRYKRLQISRGNEPGAFRRSVFSFNMKNSCDGTFMHEFISGTARAKSSLIDKKEDIFMARAGLYPEGQKPNVVFDVSGKKMSFFEKRLPYLLHLGGYKPENVHIVWVLSRLDMALKGNNSRSRVMSKDQVVEMHIMVANTILELMEMPEDRRKWMFDGNFYLVFNGAAKGNKKDVQLWDKKVTRKDYRTGKKSSWVTDKGWYNRLHHDTPDGSFTREPSQNFKKTTKPLYFKIKEKGEDFYLNQSNPSTSYQEFISKLVDYLPPDSFYQYYSKGNNDPAQKPSVSDDLAKKLEVKLVPDNEQ